MRTKVIVGNWKMHKNYDETLKYIQDFKLFVNDVNDVEIVLAVPFTLLDLMKNECNNTNIKIAAQNIFYEEQGAYTGEISGKMVKDFAEYVILGHSERRKYFNETNEIINKKIKAALRHKLKVIFCLGENLEERNSGRTHDVVEIQFREGVSGLSIEDMKNIVTAYEPVWAIGTGNTATPEQAEEVHTFLRQLIKDIYNEETAENTRIIYGGSVTPENAPDILKMENIDGCLPGGASLDPSSLAKIIKSF
jgi:triosephosphate isomerase